MAAEEEEAEAARAKHEEWLKKRREADQHMYADAEEGDEVSGVEVDGVEVR